MHSFLNLYKEVYFCFIVYSNFIILSQVVSLNLYSILPSIIRMKLSKNALQSLSHFFTLLI